LIDRALTITTREINQFLRIRFDLNEDKILLAPLVNQDGTISIPDENKIIVSLTDISEETVVRNGSRVKSGTGSQRPDLNLNLNVLFAAYFNPLNYAEALKYLSAVIGFFHAKPVFDQSSSPQLIGTGIDRLVFDIFHQDSNSKNNLWSTLGAKYMPSIAYKVRMITISDNSIRQQIDSISGVDLDKEIID
jgi:hypothetical protein